MVMNLVSDWPVQFLVDVDRYYINWNRSCRFNYYYGNNLNINIALACVQWCLRKRVEKFVIVPVFLVCKMQFFNVKCLRFRSVVPSWRVQKKIETVKKWWHYKYWNSFSILKYAVHNTYWNFDLKFRLFLLRNLNSSIYK